MNYKTIIKFILITLIMNQGLPVYAATPFDDSEALQHKESISQWKNTPVLILFWATWCGDCKQKLTQQLPQLIEKGLHVVTVNTEKEPERAQAFLKEHNILFPSFSDLSKKLRKEIQIFSVPGWVVMKIDENNKWTFIQSGNGFDTKQINMSLGKDYF